MNLEEYLKIKSDGENVDRYVNMLQMSLSTSEVRMSEAMANSADIQKCIVLFQEWITSVVDRNVISLSDLVTNGLSHVVDDQDLQFKISQDVKGNKPVFRISMINSGRESDPVEGSGGGIATLISTIIRFSLTAKFGLSKLILFDETLSSLSNAYVPAAASFLRDLCKEFNIDILMVTHNPDFISESDVSYEAINDGKLKLKRVR